MKTLYILILAIFLPLIFYASQDIRLETETVSEVNIDQEFTINIKLHKADIKGFAKLEVIFPCNIEVNAIEYSSALFISKSKNVKFIWIEIPKNEIIDLSFTARILYFTEEKLEIISKFKYLENDKTQTILSKNNIYVINTSIIANNDIIKEIELNNKEIKRRILFDLNTKLNKDLIFKVQIAALKNNINENILKELIENDFEIKEEFENDFHKYYIGNFYSLETANMFKNYCGIKGAFVIPIYNGNKITINDAKEIMKYKQLSEKN